ncbi:MAG: hypothetical protein U1G07_04300 [Verrucomicrobiota bacterium]
MSQTKLGPTLSVNENDQHESHSFWFEHFKCSLKVDRRKDGAGLAITLKTPDAKVVVNLGPQDAPRLVAQVKHSGQWNPACEYASEVGPHGAKFRLDYEPPASKGAQP